MLNGMTPPLNDAPLPTVAASARPRGRAARWLEVGLAGAVVFGWMGLIEALLLCLTRDIPEPLLFVRQAVLGYVPLGLAAGLLWAALFELISPRRGHWRRRAFYLVSLFVLLLAFQVVLHTHTHWTGGRLTPGSAASVKVTAAIAAAALAVIGLAWVICLRGQPRAVRPVIGPRTAGVLLVPLAVAALLPWFGALVRPRARTDAPNVLLIVLDTTRVDRLSAYGYGRPTTPNLDRIAQEGLLFERAYAAAPWTLPSHASIFTGEYAAVHNATWEHQVLDDRLPTVAERLAEMGLRTAAFSRQPWLSDETGLMRGFEDFYDLYWRSTTALVAAWRLGVDKLKARRGVEDKGAALVTAKFTDWIDRHGDRPFFAFINYVEPHAYYQPPAPFRERFLGDERKHTPWGRSKQVAVQRFNAGDLDYAPEDLASFSDLYDGAVAYQDSRMGEALDHLSARGLLDDTLVIITADHGENLGDHGLLGHEFCLYETLLRVPLIVRLPRLVPPGATSDAVVENRLIGALIDTVLWDPGPEAPISAERLAAVLRDDEEAGAPVFAELYSRPLETALWRSSPRREALARRRKCIILQELKYIRAQDGGSELYDVVTDPGELNDLSGTRPEAYGVLRDLLEAKVHAVGDAAGGEAPEFSEALKRRLKALGYLGEPWGQSLNSE
jgi:arylsulfatase A-like enzyme